MVSMTIVYRFIIVYILIIGIRILYERHGIMRLLRLNVFEKIGSDRELPVLPSSIYGANSRSVKFENYGDVSLICEFDF